jgi:hypothetical protein
MYKQISILFCCLVIQACAFDSRTEEQMIIDYYETELAYIDAESEFIKKRAMTASIEKSNQAKRDRYLLFKNNNLEVIEKNHPNQKYSKLEHIISNATMDLLAKLGSNSNKMVLVNPITVIDLETIPYPLEKSAILHAIMIKELTEFGVSVADDTIFESTDIAQKNVLILDTQLTKYQDVYIVNYYLKQEDSIQATTDGIFPSLLLEKSRDGVRLMN